MCILLSRYCISRSGVRTTISVDTQAANTGSCNGDSGGPLNHYETVGEKNRYVQVGKKTTNKGIISTGAHYFLFWTVTKMFPSEVVAPDLSPPQIGIVSGGISSCGDRDIPGIYTRVGAADVLSFIFRSADVEWGA